MVSIPLVSCNASSTARKLSPGTVNTRSQPWILSWSTRIRPPVRVVMPRALAAAVPLVEQQIATALAPFRDKAQRAVIVCVDSSNDGVELGGNPVSAGIAG